MTSSEPLGSAADEASRLLEAVRRWVDERVPASETTEAGNDCRYCPFCQAMAALRQAQPEVFEHVSQAVESAMAAIRVAISTHEDEWSRSTAPDVEHIDVR